MSEECLIHYGVRGMKWHIRKKQDELSDRQLLLKKQREEQKERYKNMTTSEKKQARINDTASNEELANDIEARKEELKQLTEKLIESYKDIELSKRNTRRMYERAAQIISKRKIKNARIV